MQAELDQYMDSLNKIKEHMLNDTEKITKLSNDNNKLKNELLHSVLKYIYQKHSGVFANILNNTLQIQGMFDDHKYKIVVTIVDGDDDKIYKYQILIDDIEIEKFISISGTNCVSINSLYHTIDWVIGDIKFYFYSKLKEELEEMKKKEISIDLEYILKAVFPNSKIYKEKDIIYMEYNHCENSEVCVKISIRLVDGLFHIRRLDNIVENCFFQITTLIKHITKIYKY